MAEFARFNIQLQRAVAYPLDFFHVMLDLLEHSPDLPVTSFDQGYLVPGVGRLTQQFDACRRGMHLAVARRLAPGFVSRPAGVLSGERWAGSRMPRRNLSYLLLCRLTADFYQVGLGHVRGSVGQLLGQFAIVGQQQQALAKIIKTADWIDPGGDPAQ